MAELISVTACAARLSASGDVITSQGLGKYCKAHGLIRARGKGRGKPALVDLDEVARHRRENYTREVMTGAASGARAATTPSLVIDNPPPAPSATPAQLGDAQRLKKVQADKAELELQKELGQLTPIHEVDAGLAELFAAMRSAQKAALGGWAERATADLGLPADRLRQVRALGRALTRAADQAFYTEAVRLASQTRDDASATRHRLERLAAIAHRLRAQDARAAKQQQA